MVKKQTDWPQWTLRLGKGLFKWLLNSSYSAWHFQLATGSSANFAAAHFSQHSLLPLSSRTSWKSFICDCGTHVQKYKVSVMTILYGGRRSMAKWLCRPSLMRSLKVCHSTVGLGRRLSSTSLLTHFVIKVLALLTCTNNCLKIEGARG